MSLTTRVTARYPDQLLVQLTNQNSTTATSVDTDVLAAAVTDAEAEFYTEVGVEYDDSIDRHGAVAVAGVIHFLHEYTGIQSARAEKITERWEKGLAKLAQTLGADRRILPQTSSPLERRDERSGTRPDFARSRWDRDYVLDMPGADTREDELL